MSGAGLGVGIAEPPRRQRPIAAWVCPRCRGPLQERSRRWRCLGCERAYPIVAGLPDLRVHPDRYLTLEAERSKARRLARLEPSTDVMGLATAYYAITDDVDRSRRNRYLTHLSRAEVRGEALAQQLPPRGRILEVGCGSGGLLAAAAGQGRAVEGVDIALRWLVIGRRRLTDRGLNVPLVGACAESLPYADGTFAALVVDSVLEHLDDPHRAPEGVAPRGPARRPAARLVAEPVQSGDRSARGPCRCWMAAGGRRRLVRSRPSGVRMGRAASFRGGSGPARLGGGMDERPRLRSRTAGVPGDGQAPAPRALGSRSIASQAMDREPVAGVRADLAA